MSITIKQKYNYAADVKLQAAMNKPLNTARLITAKSMQAAFALDDKHKFRLVVNDVPIDEVKSGSLRVSIDSAAIGWTAVVPFDPDRIDRLNLFKPFTYPTASVYLGGTLACFGKLYGVKPSFNDTGCHLILSGWSPVADAIDSDVSPPYEANKMTLAVYAKKLLEPFGLNMKWSAGTDKPFTRITANKTDKVIDHLLGLAKQRNKLIMSDADGTVVFHEIEKTWSAITIEEGSPPFREGEFDFDGRKRFGLYTVLSTTPRRNNNVTAVDSDIPIARHKTVQVSESDDADMKTAAIRESARALTEALTFPIPVHSWYSDDLVQLSLWQPNTLVTVISKALFIPDGFDFLVRSVEYRFDEDGARATLEVCPPQVYTGEALELF